MYVYIQSFYGYSYRLVKPCLEPLARIFIAMARRTKEQADQTRQEIVDAARRVFHECGVSRTSLEKIASVAGVTRGAVYWHFKNKAELFFAIIDDSNQTFEELDEILLSDSFENPLDAVEQTLLGFFEILSTHPTIQRTFEIMSLRCEYVDEFASVLEEVNKPCDEFLIKLRTVYARAAERGYLRAGLDADATAYDTHAFVTGIFNNWLSSKPESETRTNMPSIIKNHLALRRAST